MRTKGNNELLAAGGEASWGSIRRRKRELGKCKNKMLGRLELLKEWKVILKDGGQERKRLEPRPLWLWLNCEGHRHCGEEIGFYISSKRPQKQFQLVRDAWVCLAGK